MNLIIDLGNTNAKIAIVNKQKITDLFVVPNVAGNCTQEVDNMLKNNNYAIRNAALSSVTSCPHELRTYLQSNFDHFVELTPDTPLPIANNYGTKNTLGNDRIAAAVGANHIFRDTNVLIFDIGTAITIDFVNSDNEFEGGNISPGVDIRFKALHEHTQKLPLIEKTENWTDLPLAGKNTNDAIRCGVLNSVLFEIERYIQIYSLKYSDLKTVLTGGDSFFFERKLKKTIFAEDNLVPIGLNCILNYNLNM